MCANRTEVLEPNWSDEIIIHITGSHGSPDIGSILPCQPRGHNRRNANAESIDVVTCKLNYKDDAS